MRIGLISTLAIPVSRTAAASVEGLVWVLSHELIKLGHEVTIFATADSEVCGELVAALPGSYGKNGSPGDWMTCEIMNLCQAIKQSSRFDVLHSHSYHFGLPMQELARAPMIHTMHTSGHSESASLWRSFPNSSVTAISNYQWCSFPELKPISVIYHGVDSSQFTFRPQPEDYVCYMGRFITGKGPLEAIRAARSLGLRLVIAGPRNSYYTEYIEPLVDGYSVEYVNVVSGSARDQLLGGARALLYPIQYPEPFGLVMVEAMLCGTPVAAIGLGAVPEVIDYGITGYYSESAQDFPQMILQALTLDRSQVRERAMARFTSERMASEYAQLYEKITERIAV
jgi:glycosyltransferase involved in cell wall biosynthesis